MRSLSMLCFLFSLITSLQSYATVRVVLRADYGHGDKGLEKITEPIEDRINGIGHILRGESLGGHYDLVYQESSDGRIAQVYQCPTIKYCENNHECEMSEQYWNCQLVYQDTKKELCRYYTAGMRAYTAATWVAEEAVSGLIVEHIAFMNRGIGLIISNVIALKDEYLLTRDMITMTCNSKGFAVALKAANATGLVVATEKKKEQISSILTVFNTSNYQNKGGAFPQSYQAEMTPLRNVQLNPNEIVDGMMMEND